MRFLFIFLSVASVLPAGIITQACGLPQTIGGAGAAPFQCPSFSAGASSQIKSVERV
jgi:hypothetical protein